MSVLGKTAKRAATGMSIGEHLAEARRRMLIATAAVILGAIVAFLFYPQILRWLQHPLCQVTPKNCTFLVTSPLDGLSLRIKIAFFGGLLIALPVIFFEIWRFVTPGLKKREKRYAIPFVAASVLFFFAGCAVAFISFGHALHFLQAIGGKELTAHYQPNAYLGLIMLMMTAFGLTFEFPVILVSLELVGVVKPAQLLKGWRWAIIGIAIAAAALTPSGDPFSMFALMIPLDLFYFGSIAIGKLAGK